MLYRLSYPLSLLLQIITMGGFFLFSPIGFALHVTKVLHEWGKRTQLGAFC